MLAGIHYVTNADGTPIAVQIDLSEHGQLWLDFYDGLIASARKDEPKSSWNVVKKRLKAAGKLK